jgi:imidazolonepropionase-like amidohydrolase
MGHSLPQLAVKPWILPAGPPVILTNCRVVDPVSGIVLEGARTIKIESGRFVELTQHSAGSYASQPNANVKVVDVGGKYVCPGLIDAHVHVMVGPGVQVGSYAA